MMIIGYVRESTQEQAVNGYNLEGQIKKIELYAQLKDLSNVNIFVDAGKSAKSLNRPKMKELIDLINKGLVDTVIVHKLDRLTRKTSDLNYLLDLFKKHNVNFVSLHENIDTTTSNGRFTARLFVLLAEQEIEQTSERTKWGLKESAEQGNYIKTTVPRGYVRVNKKLVINSEEAVVIKDIFEKIASFEYSTYSLADKLVKENVFNIKWKDTRVAKIIRNTVYKGYFTFDGVDYHTVPRIVDDELWEKANNAIDLRTRNDKYLYLFRYKITCKHCGAVLCHESVRKKDNKVYLYYECANCNKRVNERTLLNHVALTFEKIISEQAAKSIKQLNNRLIKYKNRIEKFYCDIKDNHNTVITKKKELINKYMNLCKDVHAAKKTNIDILGLDKEELSKWIHKNVENIIYDFSNASICVSYIQE